MPTAIEFNHVSKQYRLGLVSTRTLSHDLDRWWKMNILGKEDPYLKIGETNDRATKGESDYVWALKDIDFKVEQGDVVGIIGKNGAGKSTLLKLLSKVTGPTTGSIKARGRIGALLEVGTGFHPEMTGRENIFLNGAILGMSRQEIASKLDEIVDFSGCERYLDTPVKRYSSGMMVRLGFAVAAHLDPEILVVDEVLAVGDAEFQKKAIGKMQDVSRGEGRTVLFVSHNMNSIQTLCHTGILLINGQVAYSGNIEDTIAKYQKNLICKHNHIWESSTKQEISHLRLNMIKLEDPDGCILNHPVTNETYIIILIDFDLLEIKKDLTIGIQLYDELGNSIYRSLATDTNQYFCENIKLGNNIISACLPIDFLRPGEYHIALDASLHNRYWIIRPSHDCPYAVSFTKTPSRIFSPLTQTKSIIAPIIEWRIK